MENTIPKWVVDAGGALGIMILIVFFIRSLTTMIKAVRTPAFAPSQAPRRPPCMDSPLMAVHIDHTESIHRQVTDLTKVVAVMSSAMQSIKESEKEQADGSKKQIALLQQLVDLHTNGVK
jgi:hypothetical protein